MKFEMSNHVAFETKNQKAAVHFYETVLGLKPTKSDQGYTQFSNEKINFYVAAEGKCPGVMLDFIVEDQEAAVTHLKKNGCEILQWTGKGQDCFFRDPYGLLFNLTEKKS